MNLLKNRGSCLARFVLPILLLYGLSLPVQAQSIASIKQSQEGSQNNKIFLKQAIAEIEVKFKVVFGYESNLVENQMVDKGRWSKLANMDDAITLLLSPLNLTYEKVSKNVYVIRPAKINSLELRKMESPQKSTDLKESSSLLPQQRLETLKTTIGLSVMANRVTGVVTDAVTNQPLPGVNIIIKGSTQGATTDSEGRYSLNISDENTTLVFSFIGYISEEVVVGNRNILDVVLSPDIKTLSEVVVVGYSTQRKRDITGAVASVSTQEIRQTPIISADQAIQGRVAGVQVQQTSGAPGGAVQVRVRGVNSTAGAGANQPLYVVDGIPLVWNETNNSTGNATNGSSPLAGLSPNDIESMEVLKDASATAIYGSRAANGVVLITTKSGKSGRTQINFDAFYGVQTLRKKIPMINARERMSVLYEWRRNAGSRGGGANDIFAINPYLYNYDGNDWQEEVFQQAAMQNYNLSFSGGNEKVTYSTSLDYLDQEGIIVNTYAKRYSARVNLDIKATERLKFGTRTAVSYSKDNRINNDTPFSGQNPLYYAANPGNPSRDATGLFTNQPNIALNAGNSFLSGTPVAALLEAERTAERYRAISSVYGELEIAKGLSFKSMFGVDYLFNELRTREPITVRAGFGGANNNQTLSLSQPRTFNWLADQLLFYRRSFGIHSIDAVLGYSAQQFTDKTFSVSAEGSTSNALDQLSNMARYRETPANTGSQTVSAVVSQFARVNYGLMDRYLLTATLRRDGSSRFGPNYRYGYFPSASVGWRVSEEPFIKNVVNISELKLRASYGSTGNQNIGNFLYVPLMSAANTAWGNTQANGVAPTRFENRDIQWERNNQFDVGVDLSIFNNRLTITADYYDKLTKGLLASAPLSVASGVGNQFISNVGSISNKGFEVAVNGIIIDNRAVRWSANFNIATNKNTVESLGGEVNGQQPFINGDGIWRTVGYVNRTEVGHPIGAFYVIMEDGQYQSWDETEGQPTYANQPYFAPGDFKLVDQNGDNIIDDKDRIWYGSPFPDFFGGFGTNVSYKGFSLDVLANFQYGNLLWNSPRLNSETFEGGSWRESYDNRWLPSNPGVVTRVPVPRNNNPIVNSNRFLEDASFLRLRTVTLGYEFPGSLISNLKLTRARVYVQANNFLTLTKYSGWDPEVNSSGSNVTTNGIDYGAYPIAKSLMLGINLGF